MKGYIHSFESLATLDGSGLRYGVFMQGCPLRCTCCHNPDTWGKGGIEFDPETLCKKISRYKPYFKEDGGVTFSGGEPLIQAEFIKEVALLLKKEGINYVIDTSGAVPLSEEVKFVLGNALEVLLDLKFWDSESYLRYTGADIKMALETLKYLNSIKKRTTVRTVIIPGINDSEEVLSRYLELLRGVASVEKYELLGFHTMGFFKYEQLGIENRLIDKPALEDKVREKLQFFVDENIRK